MLEITPAERLFVDAQTPGGAWLDRQVEESTIARLYNLVRLAPTAFNASPARFVFVRSPEARQQLLEIVSRGNRAKVQNAPLTVILGYDLRFFEELPRLFPKYDASGMFRDDPALAERTAFHSSTLQAAYLFIAARALGLDVAPLSGFDSGLCRGRLLSQRDRPRECALLLGLRPSRSGADAASAARFP